MPRNRTGMEWNRVERHTGAPLMVKFYLCTDMAGLGEGLAWVDSRDDHLMTRMRSRFDVPATIFGNYN